MSSKYKSNKRDLIVKLIIFGSTGSVGCHIVSQALAQGHDVSAFARTPSALDITHPNLSLIAGDVFDPLAVSDAVKGHDGVLVTLGSPRLTGNLRSQGTKNIIEAMKAYGVKRLICQTTLGVGESHNNLNFFWKYLMFGLLLRNVLSDHEVQERIVRCSNLDWIIVRPAAFINGPVTGIYQQGFGSKKKNITLKISRADVANFMLEQLHSNKYLHWTPGLSY